MTRSFIRLDDEHAQLAAEVGSDLFDEITALWMPHEHRLIVAGERLALGLAWFDAGERILISGVLPQRRGVAFHERAPDITCGARRSVSSIVRDVNRRLMPAYAEAFRARCAKVAEIDAARFRLEELRGELQDIGAVARSTRPWTDPDPDRFAFEAGCIAGSGPVLTGVVARAVPEPFVSELRFHGVEARHLPELHAVLRRLGAAPAP